MHYMHLIHELLIKIDDLGYYSLNHYDIRI